MSKHEEFATTIRSTDADDLWAALCSWACRPSSSNVQAETRQRLVVAASEFLDSSGTGSVDKALLRWLYALMPRSQAAESDLLLNPDDAHGWTIDGHFLLIHPGSHDRPLRDIAELLRGAAAADVVLRAEAGFGIADLVELHLRHSDVVMRSVLVNADTRLREPTLNEVTSYRSLPAILEVTADCHNPDQARAALDWATMPAPIRLATTIHDGNSSPALRVESPAGLRDLPPSVAFETLAACGKALTELALRADDGVRDRYRDAVADEAFMILSEVATVDRVSPHRGLVTFDIGRILDVTVAANLTSPSLSEDVRNIESGLAPTTGALGLVVVAQPSYTEYVSFELSRRQMMGIEDLSFICNGRRREDLYLFLESASNRRLGRVMSWDTLDEYSVWEAAGEMPHGRADLSTYVATGCRIEWDRASEPTPSRQHPAFPHRTMRTRAQHLIFWSLDDGTDGGRVLHGSDAAAFLRDQVVPAAGQVVDDLIAKYERSSLLVVACNQVQLIEELRHAEPAGWTSQDIDLTGRSACLLVEKGLYALKWGA